MKEFKVPGENDMYIFLLHISLIGMGFFFIFQYQVIESREFMSGNGADYINGTFLPIYL